MQARYDTATTMERGPCWPESAPTMSLRLSHRQQAETHRGARGFTKAGRPQVGCTAEPFLSGSRRQLQLSCLPSP